jgi:Arc/MetJ-type ribon-helix-helix transcriptional regulator
LIGDRASSMKRGVQSQDVIVEKRTSNINVCVSPELRSQLQELLVRRFRRKGHRLSMSDLGREAFYLLLDQEEQNQKDEQWTSRTSSQPDSGRNGTGC